MLETVEQEHLRPYHRPAMVAVVRDLLTAHHRPLRLVDATVGGGGHAAELLAAAPGCACLLGLDRDVDALAVAAERLREFGSRVILRHCDFADLDMALKSAGFDEIDALIADLGMSTLALDTAERGFSFRLEGPLDMRMDQTAGQPAWELVNTEREAELARILYEYGEERASRKIARAIVNARRREPILRTSQLRELVESVLGHGRRGMIHPATRTFQALRIAVNHELESLDALLERAPQRLSVGGRMAVICYHSLEDRRTKLRFRSLAAASAEFSLVTRKPLYPEISEIAENPRVRSARLRCLERNL